MNQARCEGCTCRSFFVYCQENIMKIGSTLFAALVMGALMAPAFAASDYLLELDGVKGESASTASGKATMHLRKAGADAATQPGGNGSPAAPLTLQPAQKPQSALLLPAVQKVREAASR
jgi:hypothetical protein